MRGKWLTLAALVVAAACDIPETPLGPADRELVVQAVLNPSSIEQKVMLEWSDGTRRVPPWTASVSIIDGFGNEFEATPAQSPNNTDMYSVSLTPGPNQEYSIRVVDGLQVVTGTTTTPDARPASPTVAILAFSRTKDTLRLAWPRVRGARAYYVSIQNVSSQGGRTSGTFYSSFADTSIALAGTLRTLENDHVFDEGSEAIVMVSAADENFYTYFHATIDPFAGAPPSRLNGALGVFGSVVPIVIRRLIITP